MYVVMTRVELKPDAQEACARLFEETNPALVEDQTDWLGAHMVFDPASNIVTVLATWRNVASYEKLSASTRFQEVMKQFSALFAAPPEISVNNLIVEMVPRSG